VEKLAWARALRGREATAFVACPGCVARYLADGSFLAGDLSFDRFASAPLDPGTWAAGALAVTVVVALGLGVRLAALPALWRGARGAGDEGLVVAHRLAAAAVAASLAAFAGVTTRPHFLNGAQFATVAGVLLWPFAAGPLAAWLGRRRALGALVLLAALAPAAWLWGADLGLRARPLRVVSADTLALARSVRARIEPGGVVVEPSLLEDTDFPSPLTWWAGRSVYLTMLSSAQLLPEAELHARHERLVTIFTGRDRAAALAALAETGAGWLLAPAAWPLRFDPGDALSPALEHEAGTLYRIER
ncbi:MAG TPA: hypothetical protein VKB65_05580, partial [Myxococcota bacterium]|nr:hypothetical protein [Myxococcota bacterium]